MSRINNKNNNSVLPPEVLHRVYKSLEPRQRLCQIPIVCSNWNKACQSQPFPIDTELSIHLSLFEQYFFQNSLRISHIQLYDILKTISTYPSKNTNKKVEEEEVETVYGKCKTEIKYQPLIFKQVRNGNEIKIKAINNMDFQVKELFQEKLKKKWNILSLGKDIPNRNLIAIFKNIRIYVESPAIWFDPSICSFFLPKIHDIFYSLSPYSPESIDAGLISLPVLYEIPVNVKHLTLSLLLRDYSKAIKYICNNFTRLESLDLTIKSNHVFTHELNSIIDTDSSRVNRDLTERLRNNNLLGKS
ncbi:hypothetical protein PIROE2DRAFT_58354 [Piromyces sp. E2]|nr:hypothetical protein PIROE2DRAFT_58354 [Piromyces sp. E2]|eukprot:OUM68070.1 hypothetical protein PIROE2DRAFT_58354 [Piromyces sp. E2]